MAERTEALRCEQDDEDGAVLVVTVDHPPSNLLDGAVVRALHELLENLDGLDGFAGDTPPKVLVFRSADPDFFVMHADVEGLLAAPPRRPREPVEGPNLAAALLHRLHTASVVTIGVIDGAARGGGCELLSALDFRIGSERTVIGQPEVPLGILPGAGGSVRWPRLVGRSRALDLLLTGRDLRADEALAWGWLDRLVPSGRLLDEALALARRIAQMPAASIAAVKRAVDASLGDLGPALAVESAELAGLMAAGAHVAPMRRFLAAGGQTREGEGDVDRMAEVVARTIADQDTPETYS